MSGDGFFCSSESQPRDLGAERRSNRYGGVVENYSLGQLIFIAAPKV